MPADRGILKRIRRCPFARGGRVTVRFRANGYSLYSRRSNLPLARRRLTGEADEVVVLYPVPPRRLAATGRLRRHRHAARPSPRDHQHQSLLPTTAPGLRLS